MVGVVKEVVVVEGTLKRKGVVNNKDAEELLVVVMVVEAEKKRPARPGRRGFLLTLPLYSSDSSFAKVPILTLIF